MAAISRERWSRASWLCLLAAACGGRPATAGNGAAAPTLGGVVPLGRAIVLETAGPPPPDTTVTFTAGDPRTITLRHGPPDNIVFAELVFPASAFRADSGQEVRVEVRPRPGVYGLEVQVSRPVGEGASLVFKYARFFSAPVRAREVYGSDILYERALAIGLLQPGPQLAFLSSTRPASDNLRAPFTTAGTYLVAAAQ